MKIRWCQDDLAMENISSLFSFFFYFYLWIYITKTWRCETDHVLYIYSLLYISLYKQEYMLIFFMGASAYNMNF